MDNKNAMEERVIQTLDRLNIVNGALLEAESDSVSLRMLTFAKYVLRACYLLHSESLSENSLMKPLY